MPTRRRTGTETRGFVPRRAVASSVPGAPPAALHFGMPADDAPAPGARPTIGRAGRRLPAAVGAADVAAGGSTPWAIASLVAVNLMPLIGVLGFGWSTFDLMALYWFENGIVGLFAVLKILLSRGDGDGPGAFLGRLFTAGFFTLHYGAFWSVHGLFVMTLFGGPADRAFGAMDLPFGFFFGGVGIAGIALQGGLLLAAMGLLASHAVSFVGNVVVKGEDLERTARDLMSQPYGRVVVLHVTLVLGGFLVLGTGGATAALALFVLLKTGVDLAAHLRVHRARTD